MQVNNTGEFLKALLKTEKSEELSCIYPLNNENFFEKSVMGCTVKYDEKNRVFNEN
jgi:hypothetical protein